MTPTRQTLEHSMQVHWSCQSFKLSVGMRYETGPELSYESPVGGRTTLVYDLNVYDTNCPSILEQPSSWLWFENAVVGGVRCHAAYLYVLSIKPEWRRQGVGRAYIYTKASTLPTYGIRVIYLQAGHEGPRFWSKHGFRLIDQQKFWADYEEYCEYNEIASCEDMDQVVEEYFQYLKDSNLTYSMIRELDPC